MPGMAASTSDTCELGSPPNAVEAPENNFDCEVTCACTSTPMTTSQSPVAPLISFDFVAEAFIAVSTSRVVENIRAYSLLVEACPIRHKAAAVPDVPRSSAEPRLAASVGCMSPDIGGDD